MPKISIFLVHQKQLYLDDIQTAVLEITGKTGHLCAAWITEDEEELEWLCNHLIQRVTPVDKNIFIKTKSGNPAYALNAKYSVVLLLS